MDWIVLVYVCFTALLMTGVKDVARRFEMKTRITLPTFVVVTALLFWPLMIVYFLAMTIYMVLRILYLKMRRLL